MKKQFFVVAAVIISSQVKSQLVPTLREDSTHTSLDEVVLNGQQVSKQNFFDRQSGNHNYTRAIRKKWR